MRMGNVLIQVASLMERECRLLNMTMTMDVLRDSKHDAFSGGRTT